MPETLFGKELNTKDPVLSLLDEAVFLLAQAVHSPKPRLIIDSFDWLDRQSKVMDRWRDERARSRDDQETPAP